MATLRWLLEHWWLGAGIAVVALAWRVGGWRAAVAVLTFGAAWRIYAKGRADGRVAIERRDKARRDYLQEHYDEIDRRPSDPDDAYRRLRERSRDK